MKKVTVKLGDNSYNVLIQTNLLQEYIQKIDTGKTIVIITDKKVNRLYAEQIKNSLKQQNYQVYSFCIPGGEKYKSNTTVNRIYEWMLKHHFTRDITIIAIGGGVVGDLAGFISATYMRGVRYVQIPTTLLAQVDSSIGGKVGINHKLGKNVIGAFYQPKLVLIDPLVLKTLPQRELYCGLAEIVKYSLILDNAIFKQLQQNFDKFLLLNNWNWIENIIYRCCYLKSQIVEHDEKETGLRRILNFGHTIGHALEAATQYNYFKHGEAVAWGMLAASKISFQKEYISIHEFNQIKNILHKISKPPLPPYLNHINLLELILNDKKITDYGINFILLEKIGKAKIEIIDKGYLLSAIQKISNHYDY